MVDRLVACIRNEIGDLTDGRLRDAFSRLSSLAARLIWFDVTSSQQCSSAMAVPFLVLTSRTYISAIPRHRTLTADASFQHLRIEVSPVLIAIPTSLRDLQVDLHDPSQVLSVFGAEPFA